MSASGEKKNAKLLHTIASRSGLNWFVETFVRRAGASIIMYHDPAPAVVSSHLQWLRAHGYVFRTLEALVTAIETHDFSDIPSRTVVITIDDGHKGNRDLVGVFKRFDVVPTIFLTAGVVGTRRKFWPNLLKAKGRRTEPHYTGMPFERCRAELMREFNYSLEEEFVNEPETMLSLDDVEEMNEQVDFQPHTRFHPSLPSCVASECREEIETSRVVVEALKKERCDHFSYPFGHHTAREVEVVKDIGFRSARTTMRGWNRPNTDIYRLRIVDVRDDTPVECLPTALCNLYRVAWKLLYSWRS